ncbi:sensor histidine kinase [Prauserella sp. ASG 168]|uniref:histidine kinase n=1 Tax=Prauserella cavernicola TaxID=2800127 RepID=A0A934QQR8_9PSEU|nr:histidine kinase [Prauserella cavernicola]MBK1784650.1 sensor histidine kinase [Prauserella cavernicola]
MVGDSMIALLVLLIDLSAFFVVQAQPDGTVHGWQVTVPVDIAMVAPLVLRRKFPLPFAYAVLVLGVVHSALGPGLAAALTSGIAVYSVVVYAGRKQGAVYLALTLATSVAQLFFQPRDEWLVNLIVSVLVLLLCWVLGEFVGARRAYQGEVEARLHLLETERDQATRIAVAEERGRIARELHDVVAHAVSVIVVHADGASYAIRSKPELAEHAIRTISETGRDALGELRRLLDVLRGEDDDEPRVPQPTTADLTELAESMRTAGLGVDIELDELGELPAGVSLGIYRIVQESLTNALKHAGQGARTKVRVRRNPDVVTVDVNDDGAGKAHQLTTASAQRPLSGGNGLIGMRERAHVYGGTLHAGPSPGGGWHVSARLPVRLDP